jgi:hypothetical protein
MENKELFNCWADFVELSNELNSLSIKIEKCLENHEESLYKSSAIDMVAVSINQVYEVGERLATVARLINERQKKGE